MLSFNARAIVEKCSPASLLECHTVLALYLIQLYYFQDRIRSKVGFLTCKLLTQDIFRPAFTDN